jgi:large subunit ribosomal protein L9
MKVILNKDLSTLGEEGDVKDVARGYARNYLFPRGIALPYTPKTIKLFEARKEEIEAKKAQKRQDAMGLKERLESLELTLTMPAGANGKLYGAVTSQTVADELAKHGFQIERKRVDLATAGIKNAGKYKGIIKLYENSHAEIQIVIIGQEIKTETRPAPARPARRRRDEAHSAEQPVGAETTATETPPAEQAALAEQTPVEQSVADQTAPAPEGEAVEA